MHELLLAEVVKTVRQRYEEGDCPTAPRPSGETLEDAILDLDTEVKRLQKLQSDWLSLEKQYSERLGRMAQLCDTVCTWVLNSGGGHEYPRTDVLEACNEIMDYVEDVRP